MFFHGENSCQAIKSDGQPCTNKSYYIVGQKLLCGIHSKNQPREELPKNPDRNANNDLKLQQERTIIEKTALDNRSFQRRGFVICSRMRMMKPVEDVPGYLKVFPNYKHQNRKDGYGCARLSPKSLGPVHHGQPGLPPALNLENFHQGNKVFPFEISASRSILPQFYTTRQSMYQDPVPHRHKHGVTTINSSQSKVNIPLFSVWILQNGTEKHLSYFESRQLYCNFYERLVINEPDYQRLLQYLFEGYNLQICGYDAYEVSKSIEECYCDTSRPFGHELVLYTMLTHPSEMYPWRKYKTLEF